MVVKLTRAKRKNIKIICIWGMLWLGWILTVSCGICNSRNRVFIETMKALVPRQNFWGQSINQAFILYMSFSKRKVLSKHFYFNGYEIQNKQNIIWHAPTHPFKKKRKEGIKANFYGPLKNREWRNVYICMVQAVLRKYWRSFDHMSQLSNRVFLFKIAFVAVVTYSV